MTDRPCGAAIAVVDDDQSVLESLDALLESADYTVHRFGSATALLESGCLAEIDCLISDISMPVMDGFELLRAVRAVRPGLPIIFISGRCEMLDRLASVAGAQYRLFRKPFDGQELLAAIGHALCKPPLHSPHS